jgi:hypothetical protein
MSPTTARPRGRTLQARVFRVLNVPMRALLGLPFATPLSGGLMITAQLPSVATRSRSPATRSPASGEA